MKVLLSSSHGRGRGRGRGHSFRRHEDETSSLKERNPVSRPREKEKKTNIGDTRFAARFTDPRFKISKQLVSQHSRPSGTSHHARGNVAAREEGGTPKKIAMASPHTRTASRSREGVWEELERTKMDPRFAKHFQTTPPDTSSEHSEEEEEDENVSVSGQEEEASEEVDDEQEEEEEDVCVWEEDMEYIEPRSRLAVVNCDWDHVRAVDLYALLFHGLPLGGELLEVCVYKSEFGKKMMEHEKIHGPDLWVHPGEKDILLPSNDAPDGNTAEEVRKPVKTGSLTSTHGAGGKKVARIPHRMEEEDVREWEEDDGELEEEEEEDVDDGQVDDDPTMLQEEGENGELFSSGKYRQYEFNRMKYYYAVASFDSPETAATVYQALDGMDIEASGVVLDLRYIDDSETFNAADIVSRADSIPANFKSLRGIRNPALSHTRFRISWDQEDPTRYHSVQDSFSGTTPEDDLAAYLASPLTDSEEEDNDDDEDSEHGEEGSSAAKGKVRETDSEEKLLSKSAKRKRMKQAIRRRYAALLEEIGVDPDDVDDDDNEPAHRKERAHASLPEEEEEDSLRSSEAKGTDSSSSDDDDLNRFSDIEDDEEEGDEEGMGVEGTLDLHAGEKATALQKQTKVKRQLEAGNLSEKAEVKYKLRRKEAKKLKKETARQECEREKESRELNEGTEKKKLQSLLGEEEEGGAARLRGKERRKAHANEVKARVAAQREERKRSRAAHLLGIAGPVLSTASSGVSSSPLSSSVSHGKLEEGAEEDIDPRFQQKLLSDPRFHLDVAQRDKRVSSDVTALAAKVATVKRRRTVLSSSGMMDPSRSATGSRPAASVGEREMGAASDREALDSAVDYFLHETQKKRQRRE